MNIKYLHIEMAKACNLHCQTCDGSIENDRLSFNNIKLILDSAKRKGIRQLFLTGGEPLICKDIYEIISYAHSYKINTSLATNGTLVDETVVENLFNSGLNNISFSLDGTPYFNDLIRGAGVYDKVIRAMELFNNNRLSRMVSVLFTISRVNYKTLPDVIAKIRKFGVRKIFLNAFEPSFLSKDLNIKKDIFWIAKGEIDSLAEVLSQSMLCANALGVHFPSESYLQNIVSYFKGGVIIPKYGCQIPAISTIIEAGGQVNGCWKMNTKLSIHHQTLESIWDSNEYQLIVEKAQKSECPGCVFACYSEEIK